jgi:hypothetical protein
MGSIATFHERHAWGSCICQPSTVSGDQDVFAWLAEAAHRVADIQSLCEGVKGWEGSGFFGVGGSVEASRGIRVRFCDALNSAR